MKSEPNSAQPRRSSKIKNDTQSGSEDAVKKVKKPRSKRAVRSTETKATLPLPARTNPLLLVGYDDALQVGPLLTKLGEDSHSKLIRAIAAHGGDSLALALQGASIAMHNGTFVAKFGAEATRLYKAKELHLMVDASGRHVPTLVGASGKTVQNARLLGPLAKGTRIAANLAAAAITAAHIISGIDLAKKMDRLNGKVDFLIAGRRIDQLSRLEGVYRQARELLHGGLDDDSQREIHRLGRELFEVRSGGCKVSSVIPLSPI
jgi:hypothetical protein